MSARRGLALGALVLGLGAALAITLLQPSVYRAEGTIVLVREGRAPGDDPALAAAAAGAADLLRSRTVVESAAANLGVEGDPAALVERVDVDVDAASSLLRFSFDAEQPEEARRLAQELASVFTVLYNTRFGPETTAAIWEAPGAAGTRVSPRPLRNLLLGGAAGALVALALVLLPGGRRRRHGRPAPEPAVHEEGPSWTLAELEALVPAEPADGTPDEERRFYLAALRDYARPDGRIDPAFNGLIDEVFGDVLEAQPR